MSIQSEINRLKTNINNALAAVAAKGVSVPVDATSDDLATLIEAIVAGGTEDINIPITVYGAASEVVTLTSELGVFTITTDIYGTGNGVVKGLPGSYVQYDCTASVSGFSKTVIVDDTTTEIYMMYDGALYWYGNTCDWITGGVSVDGWKYSSSTLSNSNYAKTLPVFNTNSLTFPIKSKTACMYTPVNAIDMSTYVTLNVKVTSASGSDGYVGTIGMDVEKNAASGSATISEKITATGDTMASISNVSSTEYVFLCSASASTGTRTMVVDAFWLA